MSLRLTTVMIGVEDLARSKEFYANGLGCTIEQDYPSFVSLSLGDGSSRLALYEWSAAAADAGVPPEGAGFRGVSFHFIADSRDVVDDVIARAVKAGGTVVKEAEAAEWAGYSGYFSDPDGHLWKVATNA
jgi:catechol 2,3-dioxygenase-like lactoylglutathione lyase family enzyme